MVILSGLDDVLSESSVPKCEEYYAWMLGLLFFSLAMLKLSQ